MDSTRIQLTKAQSEIVVDRHRFRVVNCGRRFGKTTMAILEMIGKAVSADGIQVAYIAPTFQQARDIAWQELKRLCRDAASNVNETRLEITVRSQYGGSSAIVLRGWESVETLRGQRFDFIVLDEVAMMRSFWSLWQEVIRPTLTDKRGECLFISTPRGFNHFYDLFNLQAKDGDFRSFHFTSYDNPFIPKDELDKARQELTEDRFAQEYLADFRKTQGLVYKEFDRQKHVMPAAAMRNLLIDKHIYGKHIGIDWGFTNPAAVLDIDEDSDATLYVRNEWYKTGKTTPQIVEMALSFRGNDYYPDPAEPDRIKELEQAGANVMEVNKDVVAGIDAVRTALKNGKLFISDECVNLISEFETYSYREKKGDQNAPEEPLKENDHALDALRYVVYMRKPLGPVVRKEREARPLPRPYFRRNFQAANN